MTIEIISVNEFTNHPNHIANRVPHSVLYLLSPPFFLNIIIPHSLQKSVHDKYINYIEDGENQVIYIGSNHGPVVQKSKETFHQFDCL